MDGVVVPSLFTLRVSVRVAVPTKDDTWRACAEAASLSEACVRLARVNLVIESLVCLESSPAQAVRRSRQPKTDDTSHAV
jgi:hypothetical protein